MALDVEEWFRALESLVLMMLARIPIARRCVQRDCDDSYSIGSSGTSAGFPVRACSSTLRLYTVFVSGRVMFGFYRMASPTIDPGKSKDLGWGVVLVCRIFVSLCDS